MYYDPLTFIIIGKTDRLQKLLETLPPIEDCGYKFKTVSGISEAQGGLDTAFIFDRPDEALPPLDKENTVKYAALLSSDSPELSDRNVISEWDDLWILPSGKFDGDVIRAYFMRFAARMKDAADSRKQSICFYTLINSVPDICWYKDTAGSHLIVNDSFCRLVGKDKKTIHKKGHCFIWDATPEDEQVCLSSDREIMDSRKTNTFEENVITKEETLLLKSWKSPLIDENGEVFGTCGIARDVTEFKNATTEIQILIDSIPYVVLLENSEQIVMSKNLVFDEFFPEYKDIIGKSSLEWKNSLNLTDSTVANLRTLKEMVITRDGEERTLIMDVEPLLDIFYKETGNIITLADVTDERRISSRLMESELKAQAANRAKSMFLAKMSHEIRTPINSIIGMNEMILRESGEHDTRNYALTAQRSAKMLLGLVNDILDFSKIESGKMEISPAKYSTAELISDVVSMNAPRAYAKKLAINLNASPELPSVLFGDDVRLRQIITNLLTNAVKYTNEGFVTISVDGKAEGDEFALSVSVKDTGMGISREDLDHLFDAFQRVNSDETRTIEGTGLGLNITNTLLALMGSKLEVKSEYGKGSEFYFTVRQKIIDASPVGEIELTAENEDDFSYSALFSAPEAKVLIVDDNDMNRVVFKNLLKQTRVQITEAPSGFDCLKLTEEQRFDIIFLDHMMPKMDGVETFRRLKSNEENLCRDVPVIALTANALSGAREEYLSEGFTDFLSKPVSPIKLEQIAMKYLPAEKVRAADEDGTLPEDALPEISGFNFDLARLYSNSNEMIRNALSVYGGALIKASSLLGAYLPVIEDSVEAFENFRIEAHALKGTSVMVGASQLSELAKTAEFAARDGDLPRIKAITPILLEETEKCLKNLEESGVYKKKPAADISDISEKLKTLAELMEEFDLDAADVLMNEIYSYSYPKELQTQIELLKIAVMNCDSDRAKIIAEKFGKAE